MSEPKKWTINEQVLDDHATGLRFTFKVNGSGQPALYIERFRSGVSGLANRDISWYGPDHPKAGEYLGSGSGMGFSDLPINRVDGERDPADAWKEL